MRKPNGIMMIIAISLVFVAGKISPSAAETRIKGKVVAVDPEIKIEYEGDYAPNEGDSVEIGFNLDGDFIPVEGTWEITKIGVRYVWTKATNADKADVAVGYHTKILSKSPKAREELPDANPYTIQIKPPIKPIIKSQTRLFEVSFKGWAYNFKNKRSELSIRIRYSHDGQLLKDYDGRICNSDGQVEHLVNLNSKGIRFKGNSFSHVLQIPFNDLDYLSYNDISFKVHLDLISGNKVLAKAETESVFFSSNWLPWVWFAKSEVNTRKDQYGSTIINVNTVAHIRYLANKDVQIAATVHTRNYKNLKINDRTYLIAGKHAGVKQIIHPKKGYEFHRINIEFPVKALKLPKGKHDVYVHLRALSKDNRYIGEIFPILLKITKNE